MYIYTSVYKRVEQLALESLFFFHALRIQEEALMGHLVLNSTSELYHDAKLAEANLKSEPLGARDTQPGSDSGIRVPSRLLSGSIAS